MTPFEPRSLYHVYSHANGNDVLFRTDDNYQFFLKQYAKYIAPIADTFAFCLMPNHFHVIIRTGSLQIISPILDKDRYKGKEAHDLFSVFISQQFSHFLNSYTQAYNKVFKRKGSLFTPNFKRSVITDNLYYTKAIVYVHANPIHHRFTSDYHEWRYSSYNIYLSDKPTSLNRDEGLSWFGNRNEFIKIHSNLKPVR